MRPKTNPPPKEPAWARATWHAVLLGLLTLCGCGDAFTDAATRLAYDLESSESRLDKHDGAIYVLQHHTPSKTGECTGPYKVQLDKVGALIIWCYDATGKTVSSHSTSYHARFVDTPQTYILDKAAGTTLRIDIERRGGRAVITKVQ